MEASIPWCSSAGPLVSLACTPISVAMIWARVVLPSPGGP